MIHLHLKTEVNVVKRILIIVPGYKHGGTNKSLYNILSLINLHEYNIKIFSLSKIGPYKDIFSKYVLNISNNWYSLFFDKYKKIDIKKDSINQVFLKIFWVPFRYIFRLIIKDYEKIIFSFIAKKMSKMQFDTIIAFQEGTATRLASFIDHKKIAWVHSDYNEYQKIVGKNEKDYYDKYDSIICVSEFTRGSFLEHYPELQEKTFGIHNMINYSEIIKMSESDVILDDRFTIDEFCIISIGRLSKIKQFDIIPEIAYELSNEGYLFRWYIIGDGEERDKILNNIRKYKLHNRVILLGEKDNPYPYIKKSDLVVITSKSEACPNVVNEAKILHIPIVTTDFGSVSEFLTNEVNALIVSKNELSNAMKKMIKKDDIYYTIKDNIKTFKYSNEHIIKKITEILLNIKA
jgi:glycosyltransferase involved in cell wall biosynthesis